MRACMHAQCGWSSLFFSLARSDGPAVPVFNALLHAGANVCAMDSEGWNAISYAARQGKEEQCRALVESMGGITPPQMGVRAPC